MARPAVVLLSGGLGSGTTTTLFRAEGFTLFALLVDYGQRHRGQLEAAGRMAEASDMHWHVVLSAVAPDSVKVF